MCSQFKTVTTAIAFTVILRKKLSIRHWVSVVVITVGVILCTEGARPSSSADSAEKAVDGMSYTLGLGAVLLQTSLAGVSSVYFEKVLKSKATPGSVWDRNIQLASCSLALYTPILLREANTSGGVSVMLGSITKNFWIIAALGAGGGILVALSVKHTDSVMKNVAMTGALVATYFIGAVFLGAHFNVTMGLGSVCVCSAVWAYTMAPSPQPAPVLPVKHGSVA